MAARDHHTALRTEVVNKTNANNIEAVLAKLQWGKDDIAYTLHVSPTSFGSSGLQTTHWLRFLGFQENKQCQFSQFNQCFSAIVPEGPEGYDLRHFSASFADGFSELRKADDGLMECGFWMPNGRQLSPQGQALRRPLDGDGHSVMTSKVLNTSEDDEFSYKLTFVETGKEKGFVTHYRPLHPPLSSEVRSVFGYLGLKENHQCPEFDFEECHYRTLRLFETGNPFDGNVGFAHQSFDAHATRFSAAIEALLSANAAAERIGLKFLPIARPAERLKSDIAQQIRLPTSAKPAPKPTMAFDAALPTNFDVAISFAGTERELAERFAELLRLAGIAVFYDNFYPEHLWGKNLTAFLDEIYRKRSKYCVVFVSTEYKERKWTNHELRSAQAKALEQKGDEYILPVKVDDVELDGLPPNVGYISVSVGIEKIADLLIKKLHQ
jgi:hypothetical protein